MSFLESFSPSRRHADLGPEFFDLVHAARFPMLKLRYRNQAWASRIGLADLSNDAWLSHFGRFVPLPGSFDQPLALRYHGHQFRNYNPELGDGRGFLFAQLHDAKDGRLLDLGTKGSGTTPWSRAGDGRLTLKGGVREVLATAMLEALGVYTSKSLSLIETGEELVRGDEPSPTRSSVLVRLNHGHIRIGTFQRLAYEKNVEALRRLVDHSIQTLMPECWRDTPADRCVVLLREVCLRVARMGAQWMVAGFVHGVLNTDNINITGESFDYGPWRFVPTFDPAFTAAYFDHSGLYAFGRQPDTLLWNLARFAETLTSLSDITALEQALATFVPAFRSELGQGVVRRLGLIAREKTEDANLAQSLWDFLMASQAPFEQVLYDWFGGTTSAGRAAISPAAIHYDKAAFLPFRSALEPYVPDNPERLENQYFLRSTPCTMLIDEVEAIWAPIAESDDWSTFHAKLADIAVMGQAYGTLPASSANVPR